MSASEQQPLLNEGLNNSNELPIEDQYEGYALPKHQLKYVVLGLYTAAYLAALDATVVSTLLSIIASDLNDFSNMSWIATAYLLSCSALQPIYGKLSDIFGRKALILQCCFFFSVGCAICTLNSMKWVIFGRFVTGIGGSGLTTLTTITLSDLIPLRDRGVYQGYTNVFYGLGTATGGVFGGVINDVLGWRYAFWLQIPISVFVGSAIYYNLQFPAGSLGLGSPGHLKEKIKKVDFLGLFLLVSTLAVLLLAASLGGKEIKFASKTFKGLCVAFFVLLLVFFKVELSISDPIIPVHLFKRGTILASSLTNWFYTMGAFTYLFYVPIYYSSVMNYSGTQVGLRLAPNFFSISIGSVGAGYYMKRTGKYRKLSLATGILALAGIINILLITPRISVFRQFTLLLPSGLAYSSILTIVLLALISAVPNAHQAAATSILYTFRATGSTLGVSIASAIYQLTLQKQLDIKIHKIISDKKECADIIRKALESTNYANHAPSIIKNTIIDCYELACKSAFLFAFLCINLGFISSMFIREHTLHATLDRK